MQRSARKRRRQEAQLEAKEKGATVAAVHPSYFEPPRLQRKGVMSDTLQQYWPTFKP